MIKGINKLNEEQLDHIYRVNKLHIEMSGNSKNMEITETWIDGNGCTCVRLKNGDWYHYSKNNTWY